MNPNATATLLANVRLQILGTGGLRNLADSSPNVTTDPFPVGGTWGALQPTFVVRAHLVIIAPVSNTWIDCLLMSVFRSRGVQGGGVAVPGGPSLGLDAGDMIVLRFDQNVWRIPVATKTQIDAAFTFSPGAWAEEYTGLWLSNRVLAIIATRCVLLLLLLLCVCVLVLDGAVVLHVLLLRLRLIRVNHCVSWWRLLLPGSIRCLTWRSSAVLRYLVCQSPCLQQEA